MADPVMEGAVVADDSNSTEILPQKEGEEKSGSSVIDKFFDEQEKAKADEGKTEPPVEEKKEGPAPIDPGKYAKTMKELRAMRRENEALKAGRSQAPAQQAQVPIQQTPKDMSPEEVQAHLAALQRNPVDYFNKVGQAQYQEMLGRVESQLQDMRWQMTSTNLEGSFKNMSEAKTDPDFDDTIADIITQNLPLANMVKQGQVPADSFVKFCYAQYRDARGELQKQAATADNKAREDSSGKVSKAVVASAIGGKAEGKRFFTTADLDKLDTLKGKERDAYRAEIDRAMEEGRIRD